VEGIEENGVEGVDERPGIESCLRCCANDDDAGAKGSESS
jgi:hypothetical protein